jgi:hypothetical protein
MSDPATVCWESINVDKSISIRIAGSYHTLSLDEARELRDGLTLALGDSIAQLNADEIIAKAHVQTKGGIPNNPAGAYTNHAIRALVDAINRRG